MRVQGRRQTDSSDEISLGTVARAVWRNKRAIIGPTILIAAAAFVAVNLMTPRFKSEARVLVEGRENIFLRPEAENKLMDRGSVDPETVTSQVQLVLSRDLAREVIKELNLAELPEFNAALNEFSPLSFLRTIGILKDPMSMTLEERVLGSYYDRLQAFALDKSRVISIEFQSADPELAPKSRKNT
jgi:succinoglycan biosynthesis transport protein ExoP